MSEEIELDLQIDPHRLDDEWVAQVPLYHQWAAELADARRDSELEKSSLEVTKAELYLAVRTNPAAYALEKVTEAALAATVAIQKGYVEAQKKVIKARHRVDVTEAAVKALDHRKTALSKLVDLFLADYFSRPWASEGGRERMGEVEKRAVRRKGRPKKGD